jgi:hypothetical protein
MGYHVVTGAIHIHTLDSDGTKTHEEVAAIGRDTGLDFLLFTDHMTLQSMHEGKEKFYGDLLLLIGYEHNDRDDCNHYLLFDIGEVLPATMTAAEYVAAGAAQGALGIMAHPDEIRGRDTRFRSYPWTDWEVGGFNGLELWNQMSEWMENLRTYNQIRMVFSPRRSLNAPTSRILRKWDELSQSRRVVGIGSVDAHGFLYRAGPLRLTIFPYKVQFRTLRTHLILYEPLSRDFATAKRQVYDALRDCRAFISNFRWGDARDFQFKISGGGQSATCGGQVTLTGETRLTVSTSRRSTIRLIGNGRVLAEEDWKSLDRPVTEAGIYRVELYRGRKGWIFSNHIRVIEPTV